MNFAKPQLNVYSYYSTSQEDKFEWLKNESSRVIMATPQSCLLRGVDFRIQIYPRIRRKNRKYLHSSFWSPRCLIGYKKKLRKPGSLDGPFNKLLKSLPPSKRKKQAFYFLKFLYTVHNSKWNYSHMSHINGILAI